LRPEFFTLMSYVSWRNTHLSGGACSPFERAMARQAALKRVIAAEMRKSITDQEQLHRLLVRAQRISKVIAAEGVRDPATLDPRKIARPNTGRVSKPDLPAAPRGGRVRAHQGTIG
jgi:hypothetical protein